MRNVGHIAKLEILTQLHPFAQMQDMMRDPAKKAQFQKATEALKQKI